MQDIFETKSNNYNTRNGPAFSSRNMKTVRYGLQTISSYMAPTIWDFVPKEIKQITALNEFKTRITIWKLENFPCRLNRTYLPQIGFITYSPVPNNTHFSRLLIFIMLLLYKSTLIVQYFEIYKRQEVDEGHSRKLL